MGSYADVDPMLSEFGFGGAYEYDSNGSYPLDYDFYGNGTNKTLVLHPRLGYSTLQIIISSIILTFMMIVVVIGNMLVIIAIATEKSLKNLQNWFIASLAVADFFVGLLIMPFSLANELMGYWIFGAVWCSIHSAMDVLLCTSSIMNICLISLDRYWSITQAVDYLKKRTPVRAAVMIGMVWVLSALISIPPLLGWRDPDAIANQVVPKCELSREIGYVLYSALGSFYIPSCIMVFVYIRIYFAARARARRAVRKPPKAKPKASSIEIQDKKKTTATTTLTEASKPKAPLSAPAHLMTSQGALNAYGKSPSTNSPMTPEGRCVKQVGFQDPLVMTNEVVVKPEITVQGCTSEDLLGAANKKAGDEKTQGTNKSSHESVQTKLSSSSSSSVSVPPSEKENGCGSTSISGVAKSAVSISGALECQKTEKTCSDYGHTSVVENCENVDSGGGGERLDRVAEGNETGVNGAEKGVGRRESGVGDGKSGGQTDQSLSQPEEEKEKKTNLGERVEELSGDGGGRGGGGEEMSGSLLLEDGADTGSRMEEEESEKDAGIESPVEIDESGYQPLVPTIQLRDVHEDPLALVAHHSALAVSELENKISELQSNGSGSRVDETTTTSSSRSSKKSKRPKLHFLRVETPTIWRTSSSLSLNGDVHILGTLSRSCSRLQLDTDPVSDVEPSSSDSGAISRCAVVKPLKLRLCQPFFGKKSNSTSGKARRDVLDMGKLPSPKQEIRDPEREKRRIARKKEKRATLILGLIMGSFILCWLPFFFLYILEPLCPSCQVAPWGFAIAFWLGYMNSALNPVIYTIFNKDFRRAFRRILFK